MPVSYIDLLSKVSSRTGIPPARVAYTLAENPDLNLTVWQNRLEVRESQSRSDSQAERVIEILKAFRRNFPLATSLGSELKETVIKNNLRALAAN